MTADSLGVRGLRYQRRNGYVLECFMMVQSYNTKYPFECSFCTNGKIFFSGMSIYGIKKEAALAVRSLQWVD